MTDKANLDAVKREELKNERADFEKAKRRIRIMNYVLGRANDKLSSMILDGLPEPKDFESLEYDLGALRILWRKHLAWLGTVGLRGVGPNDTTRMRDCFDEGDDRNFPVEILEG
jgi:hypothetical protein